MGPCRMAGLVLMAFVTLFPLTLDAQARYPTAGEAQTDEELRGETFFNKTCFLCHNPTAQTIRIGVAATDLVGLFKRPEVTEEYVQERIQGGLPGLMPAYRDTFTPAQLDNLIAYLKIR